MLNLSLVKVSTAITAAEALAAKGISARVVDMYCIKPIDAELIEKCAKETGAVVTAEEHSVIGGLGGAVAEVLAKAGCAVPTEMVGMQDRHGESVQRHPSQIWNGRRGCCSSC